MPDEDPDEATDQPDLDDEEIADLGAVADEIEDSTSPDAQDDVDEDGADAGDDGLAAPGDDDVATDRTTPGDIYCNGLGMMAAVGRTSYGSADEADRSDLTDEYAAIARDLEIDDYVDEWLDERGGVDELSPGQAVVVTTLLWGGMVAMDDPEIVEGIANA